MAQLYFPFDYTMHSAVLITGLVILATAVCSTVIPEESAADALQSISEMEADLYRFYDQWRQLRILLGRQALAKAISSCEKTRENCTSEKMDELKLCIDQEMTAIYNRTIEIYDRTIKTPWEKEFERLKNILENPFEHKKEDVHRAIQTVDRNTKDENSTRYRFYMDLVNFQLPNVSPDLRPIDTHIFCLERSFPKQ